MKIQINLQQSKQKSGQQSDAFNPKSYHCQHYDQINPYLSLPTNLQFNLRKTAHCRNWMYKIQVGMIWCSVLSIVGMLSGFTNLDFYLVKLPIDPDWLTLARICMGILLIFLPAGVGIFSIPIWKWSDGSPGVGNPVDIIGVGLIFTVFGLIALPGTCAANTSENNYNAIKVLNKVKDAQETYFKKHSEYATSINQLIQSSEISNGLTTIEARIETVGYQGYRIVSFRTCLSCFPTGYAIQVAPTIRTGYLKSGSNAYFLDETGNIRHSRSPSQLADVNSDFID